MAVNLEWMEALKRGDKVMVYAGDHFCNVSSVWSASATFVSTGSKQFRKADAGNRLGYHIRPFDAAVVKQERQKNKCLKTLSAVQWGEMPLEKLKAIVVIVEETP